MYRSGKLMRLPIRGLLLWLFTTLCGTGSVLAQEPVSEALAQKWLSERGEIIIRFARPSDTGPEYFTTFLSIDDYRNDTLVAYANEAGYKHFLSLGIPYEVMRPPSLLPGLFKDYLEKGGDWRNSYPAYADYEALMEQFSADHPDLCKLVSFGTSVNSHKLLAMKISDNPEISEKEPAVLYTSTMHGDEVTGYILMLRLIEELLIRYPSDPQIKRLVDSVEIWINPLSNPDGAYFLSDLSVEGATRLNANGIDLNRDFPDLYSQDWESSVRQPETKAMMDFMEDIRPVLSANFHGGAELVNYPWDTWDRLHADNAWYWYISRAYADTVHVYSTLDYMNDKDNGITNGHDWYSVIGGRQDYTNYFLRAREVTIELSADKMPVESKLENYWMVNKPSMLHFIGRALSGITGEITDSVTGQSLEAMVTIKDHDTDNSNVLSSPETGIYYRLTFSGYYSLVIYSPGYQKKKLLVFVSDGTLSHRDIKLQPLPELGLYPNPFSDLLNIDIVNPGGEILLDFTDLSGRKVRHISQPVLSAGKQVIAVNGLASGVYIVNIVYGDQITRQILVKDGF